MRSKIAQRILDNTPKETEVFVRLYGDIVARVHHILKAKGFTQKDLAERLDKKPSEINKWLKGEHNLTLRSIAKLEAELGETIISVPKQYKKASKGTAYHSGFTVTRNPQYKGTDFQHKISVSHSGENTLAHVG